MQEENYKNFWDIVCDWRHYSSARKMHHAEFRETAERRLEYLTNKLKTLFKFATDQELQIFEGYFGILFPEQAHPEPNLQADRLYQAVQSAVRKFDRIVRCQRITCVDEIE